MLFSITDENGPIMNMFSISRSTINDRTLFQTEALVNIERFFGNFRSTIRKAISYRYKILSKHFLDPTLAYLFF